VTKKIDLDPGTVRLMRQMLNTPPKPHDEMKVGRPAKKKKRGPKRPRLFRQAPYRLMHCSRFVISVRRPVREALALNTFHEARRTFPIVYA